MSVGAYNTEMDAADFVPLTIGRGSGMTLKEFNRLLNAFMRKKKMPKLTLGGGPARCVSVQGNIPMIARGRVLLAVDSWGEL